METLIYGVLCGTIIISTVVHTQKAEAEAGVHLLLPTEALEPDNSLGVDPIATRVELSSSDEIHMPPFPKGPPKAKPRPKPKEAEPKAAGPKQPDTPLPRWTPSLRSVNHPMESKVTTSITSVPPPRPRGWVGAAPWRSTAATSLPPPEPVKPPAEAKVASKPDPKVSEPKASEAKASEAAGPVNLKQNKFIKPPLPPPNKAPVLGLPPPPVRPPRPSIPRGDRLAKAAPPAIPPPPQHPLPSPEELAHRERGRRTAEELLKEREEAADKSPAPRVAATSAPPPRFRSRMDPNTVPRPDGIFRRSRY